MTTLDTGQRNIFTYNQKLPSVPSGRSVSSASSIPSVPSGNTSLPTTKPSGPSLQYSFGGQQIPTNRGPPFGTAGKPPPGFPPGPPYGPPVAPAKKKTNWVKFIIGGVLIVAIIIVVILVVTLTGGSSGDNNGNNGNNNNGGSDNNKNPNPNNPNAPNVPKPSPDAPFQSAIGTGGACKVDTDCPVILEKIADGSIQTYSQYCINSICVTNKVCTANVDCQSVPDIPELDTCNLAGTGTASKCRYTAGCAGGYCQRLGCKSTTDCGLNEACSINNPLGDDIGVCLPIGNVCSNSVNGNSAQCWAGLFGCTAYSGVAQGQVSQGYCTECYVGNDNSCNISNTPLGGPGAYCETVTGFTGTISGDFGAPPAVCKTNDNFKYFDCPDKTVAGSTLNGNTVCCASASSVNTCGKKCLDDYQCGDNCPYCVPLNGDVKNRVCSCIRISPTQDGYYGAQSEYACVDGYGITYDFNTGNIPYITPGVVNQINPNAHVCVKSETAVCAFNYDAVNAQIVGGRGDVVCSNASRPYCELKTGTCKDTLEGSVCATNPLDGSSTCNEISEDGVVTISQEYACTINHICTKRSYLIAGENCTPPAEGYAMPCGQGLVCSLPMGSSNKRICVPDGFSSSSL